MAKKKDRTEENITAVEEALSKSEIFIERNQKILTTIIFVIILVVLAFFALRRFYIEPREKDAQALIYKAEQYFEQDSLQLALDGDGNYPGFLDIISEYRWTKTARLANYYAGIIYLEQGEFEEAIRHLKKFKSDDFLVGNMALAAQGDAWLELDKPDKAARLYVKAAKNNVNDFATPMFLMKAAMTYEHMGQYQKALNIYEKIKSQHVDSQEGREAEKYIARARMMIEK
ncbi:MAG: tetratricopeptide repeat protein [Bacteroidales bacterium]|nr:tetratricopeptide repeat protein [Bacteroidales bacterium]MDZ4203740.1 tetratricopeptide repeat protein [Bacteroidales bacterium]